MAITKKLLAFQMQDISIKKDGNNPHFKSNYATLNEVLAKVKAPLNALGIVIVQYPTATGLTTELYDTEDDTKVSCFMPYVDTSTAQKLGSCNTYLRRYSLVTLLSLEDEDDDGEKASAPVVQYAPKSKPVAKSSKSAFERASEAIDKATDEEAVSKLETAITDHAEFTDVEKATLLTKLDARAQLIPE
jgi:hypothetical protein